MAVYDRWHTTKPRQFHPKTGLPVTCEHRAGGKPMYPSADHGKGDRWQVRWRDLDGKQHKRNFTKKAGKNPAAHADAFDAKIVHELKAGLYVDPSAGDITLADYARQWRSAQSVDLLTAERYDSQLKVHIYGRDIGKYTMTVLAQRPSLVQQWIAEQAHLSPETVRTHMRMLSSIFLTAIDDGIVTRNPVRARSVKPPASNRAGVEVWDRVMVLAAQEVMPPEYRAMVDLCVGAGCRQGEAFAIAAEDIAAEEILIRRQVKVIRGRTRVFDEPKWGRTRVVPLSDQLAARLRAHLDEYGAHRVTLPWATPDGPPHSARLLFVTATGAPLLRPDFNKDIWHKARVAAGAPDTRAHGMHVLRHTAASSWLSSGIDIVKVAAWLGHAKPSFTLETYTHLMRGSISAARKVMGAFFDEEPDEAPKGDPSP